MHAFSLQNGYVKHIFSPVFHLGHRNCPDDFLRLYDWPVLPPLPGRQKQSHFCQMHEGMIHTLKSQFAVHVQQILNYFCTIPIQSYSGVYVYWLFHKSWQKTARKHSQFWVKDVHRCDDCHIECLLDILICMHEINDAVSAFSIGNSRLEWRIFLTMNIYEVWIILLLSVCTI